MSESIRILDAKGRPIEVGARVYVRARQGSVVDGSELPSFGGTVKAVVPGCITIIEFGTCHTRDIHPQYVTVQRGENRASLEHAAILREARKRSKK